MRDDDPPAVPSTPAPVPPPYAGPVLPLGGWQWVPGPPDGLHCTCPTLLALSPGAQVRVYCPCHGPVTVVGASVTC